MTDRQCLRCCDPLQSSSAISNYCMPCQMRLASSIDTERAARLAAEARVKEMDEVLRKCLDYVLDTTPFANGPDTPLSKRIRAALKEPANG